MKKFDIEVIVGDWQLNKSFIGTNEAAHNNADNWRNMLVQDYYVSNNIEDCQEQERILDSSTYTITYDDNSLGMYAVYRTDCCYNPIIGVYYSREEAEKVAGNQYSIQQLEVFGIEEIAE